jgi:hypothetical protein
MEIIITVAICIIGVGWTSYKIGIREGAEKMLEQLQEGKIIFIDDEGQISPRFTK